MTTGLVFDLKKFAIHDGPGIRTTVFLKGCPLHCLWCHNPESQSREPEISFVPSKCIGCGWCFRSCPAHCHVMRDGKHVFDRTNCVRCGICVRECYAQALELVGKPMTVEEVLTEVLKDRPFYEHSGGGMTISGGEPMAQYDFTRELLERAKQEGLHNCLDTSGFALWRQYEKLLPSVDIFLYDLKATDPARHMELTGVPLEPILRNLEALDAAGAETILRCPLVPGVNDDDAHLLAVAAIAEKLRHVREITLHPYHPLGESKLERMGYQAKWQGGVFAPEETVRHWLDTIAGATRVPVRKA